MEDNYVRLEPNPSDLAKCCWPRMKNKEPNGLEILQELQRRSRALNVKSIGLFQELEEEKQHIRSLYIMGDKVKARIHLKLYKEKEQMRERALSQYATLKGMEQALNEAFYNLGMAGALKRGNVTLEMLVNRCRGLKIEDVLSQIEDNMDDVHDTSSMLSSPFVIEDEPDLEEFIEDDNDMEGLTAAKQLSPDTPKPERLAPREAIVL